MLPALPATISKLTTMSDNTLRIQLDCQEMEPEAMAELFSHSGTMGYFFYHPNFFSQVETKELPPLRLEKGEKTPSERLRAVLYVFWEQKKIPGSFEDFYRHRMGLWIDQVKDKLT